MEQTVEIDEKGLIWNYVGSNIKEGERTQRQRRFFSFVIDE